MKIDTIVFDMDGTVLNTLKDLTASVNFVLQKVGFPPRTEKEYRRFFGNGIAYALKCAVPDGTPDSVIDGMIPLFKERYDAHCLDNTGPYDGVVSLMKRLRENGYRLAIVSNKIDSAVKELNRRFFSEYVDVAIGEGEGVKRKPAPDTVFRALRELGASKETAVYVGDSEVDFQTAVNAGIPCISVLWGFRDKGFLVRHGATLFAETPDRVLSILRTLEK